jgi:hypothetical protein
MDVLAEDVIRIVKRAPDLFDPTVPRPDPSPFLKLHVLSARAKETRGDAALRRRILDVADPEALARAELSEKRPHGLPRGGPLEEALFWIARRNRSEWALRSLGLDVGLLLTLLPMPDQSRVRAEIDKINSGYVQMDPPIHGVFELLRKSMELGDLPDIVRSMGSELPQDLVSPVFEAERSIGRAFLRVLPLARDEVAQDLDVETSAWAMLFEAAGIDFAKRSTIGGPRVEGDLDPESMAKMDDPDLAIEKAVADGGDAMILAVRAHDREEQHGDAGELLPPLRNAVVRFRGSLKQARRIVKAALGGPWTPAEGDMERWKDALADLKDTMEKLDDYKEKWKL